MTATHIPPEVILQMQEDAKTMTCKQMAEKHGTTRESMRNRLNRLGIECQRVRSNWSKRADELKTAAARMTPRELAEHFGMSTDYVYKLLERHEVKAVSATWPVQFKGGLDALRLAAPSMTVAELAAHLEATPRAVRSNLKRLGMECKSSESAPKAPQAPKVKRPAPVPQRAAAPKLTTKREVQIITPANVKRTIVPFCPSKDARFCNGSSAVRYDPKARTVSVRGGY